MLQQKLSHFGEHFALLFLISMYAAYIYYTQWRQTNKKSINKKSLWDCGDGIRLSVFEQNTGDGVFHFKETMNHIFDRTILSKTLV